MHKLLSALLVLATAGGLILAACQQGAVSVTTPAAKETGVPKPVTGLDTEKAALEKLVAEAQKEKNVVVAAAFLAEAREAVTSGFKKKYGIDTEWVVGRPAELEAKIKQERAAGLFIVDVGIVGVGPYFNTFKTMTIPLKPMFVLEEVKKPDIWLGGSQPFYDDNSLMVTLFPLQFYVINLDMVKMEELTSTLDLLNPKWKGQIVISDPRISGQANDWFIYTLVEILGREKGIQFMKDLLKQDPVITRDERLLTEWVAQRKYAIGVSPSTSIPIEFIKKGARIAFADVKEPRELTPGHGLLYAFKDSPHPKAQNLFVNWILSKEGSSVFAPALGYPSTRLDVPTDSFLPFMVPRKGDVNVYQKYDFASLKNEGIQIAREIFAGK